MSCNARAGSTLMAIVLTVALLSTLYMLGSASHLSVSIFAAKLVYLFVLALALVSLGAGERAALRTDEHDRGDAISVEVARGVARAARLGATVLALASLLAGTAIIAVGVSTWALGLPIVSLVHAAAVATRARRVLGAGFDGVEATTTGSRIFVVRGGRLVSWLMTSRDQVAAQQHRAMPAAIARIKR